MLARLRGEGDDDAAAPASRPTSQDVPARPPLPSADPVDRQFDGYSVVDDEGDEDAWGLTGRD